MEIKKEKGYEILKREEIKGTPFLLITERKDIEKEEKTEVYYAVLGQYKMTEEMNNKEDVIAAASEISWDFIMRLICIVGNEIENGIKENLNLQKNGE